MLKTTKTKRGELLRFASSILIEKIDMKINDKEVNNITLDGKTVTRISENGVVLYEHKTATPKFLRVDIDTNYFEYPLNNAYIKVDDGDPIYLTEPLYVEVTNSTHITGDGGVKWCGWSVNGVFLEQFRTFDIQTESLNEDDNDILLISMT